MRALIANSSKTLFAAAVTFGLLAIVPDSAVSQSNQRTQSSRYRFVETEHRSKSEQAQEHQSAFTIKLGNRAATTQAQHRLAPIIDSEDAPRLEYETNHTGADQLQPVQDMATQPREQAFETQRSQEPFSQIRPDRATQATYAGSPLIRNGLTRQAFSQNQVDSEIAAPSEMLTGRKLDFYAANGIKGRRDTTDNKAMESPRVAMSNAEFLPASSYQPSENIEPARAEPVQSYGQSQYDYAQDLEPLTRQPQADLYFDDRGATYMDQHPEPVQQLPFRDQFSAFATPIDYRSKLYTPYRFAPQSAIFGVDPSQCCDEWAGFCGCQQFDYDCKCGGLKADPTRFGSRWLRSKEPCDISPGCSLGSRCKSKANGCSSRSCSGGCSGGSLLGSRKPCTKQRGNLFSKASSCNCGACAESILQSTAGCSCGSCGN